MKKTLFGLLVILLSLLLVGAGQSPAVTRAAALQDPPPPAVDQAVETAMMAAVQQNRVQVLALMLYDVNVYHIQYSADGETALVWLSLVDTQTDEVQATEPALSIARKQPDADPTQAKSWLVVLPNADDWALQLQSLPSDLLTEDIKLMYLAQPEEVQPAVVNVFTGYKLPWSAGLQKRVTNSIGHVYTIPGGLTSCAGTCRYAFDFADGTMFPLLASKGGSVKAWKTICPNNQRDCTNYLVLEDQSTTPVSYQLYFHLMNESVPARLRAVGAPVLRGEFIGNTDNTGFSTGSHLHYHVYTNATGANWSWGNSVDFIFEDVTDNGGRPRTCAEVRAYPNLGSQCQKNNLYTSGNVGAYPPVGDISSPGAGFVNSASSMTVTGFTHDDQGVTKVQVLGYFNSLWNNLGDAALNADGTFSKEVNICSSKIPMGSINLAVRIFDREGNQALGYPGQRTITNQQACSTPPPPPVCKPGADEVALYATSDFLGSACKKFAIGSYDSSELGSLGNERASSIQVGANVRAILYDFSSDLGTGVIQSRIETFESDDASLVDNRIGDNHVSAVWVQARPLDASQLEPFLTPPSNTQGVEISSLDSLVLAWEGGEGANEFRSEIQGQTDKTYVRVLNWQYTYTWSIGNLPAGTYNWTVTARNSAYPTVTNSTSKTFTVVADNFTGGAGPTAPFTEDFEPGSGNWTATGLWRYGAVERGNRPSTKAWVFNDDADYQDSVRRGGDLTSPAFTLPAGAEYYLRFSSYADIEDGNPYWDQRRVQISINNGAFIDLYQFMDDKQEGPVWIASPAIKLVDANGQAVSSSQVRIRFHFNAIDEDYNSFWGWMIDNLSINSTPPDLSCADGSNSPAQALPIAFNQSVNAVICPQGDVDYFTFTARAGQTVQIDLTANPEGLSTSQNALVSLLDSYIFLLDSTGKNVLMENDDEISNTTLKDSRMTYILQRDGVYYVKVRAWDNPGAGGPQYFYSIKTIPYMGEIRTIYMPVINR